MVKLANGAKVLAAYITVPDYPDPARATGVVLAEWHTNCSAHTGEFVTWRVWEGDPIRDIFEAEIGNYFAYTSENRGDRRQEAEIDFGRRLAMYISANACEGLSQSCGGT